MTMLAGEREPLNSDFYVKWVRPLGFRDVIGVLVLRSGKRVAWFSVARSDVQSRFDEPTFVTWSCCRRISAGRC